MLQTSDFGQAKEFNLPVFTGISGMFALFVNLLFCPEILMSNRLVFSPICGNKS
jgi:hypothetical protein